MFLMKILIAENKTELSLKNYRNNIRALRINLITSMEKEILQKIY